MYDITAYLTIKNKTFYTVLTYYVDGIRKMKWVSTGFKENESKKKAEKKLIQIRDEFKNKLETITTTKTEDKKVQILFSDFMIKWLDMIKHQVEESTYTGYKRQIEGRTKEYFTKNPVMLEDLKPVHILDFYNWLYSQGLKGTTVTKYYANIRKALDYAVQTDLIPNNPAIKVGRPQQEQFIADYYNEEELNNLFKVVKDTPLELIVYLTAFYGLRRSEVLGIRWSAIDFENKTIRGGEAYLHNPNKTQGVHWRFWYSLYQKGALINEFSRVIGIDKISDFKKRGIIGTDIRFLKYLRVVCNNSK